MISADANTNASTDSPNQADVHWLSEGAEKLIRDQPPRFDVVIVGSGYGGAVAASRFAGTVDSQSRALSVAVFERGREYIPGSFPSRCADLAGHVRFTSGSGGGPRGRRFGLFDLKLSPDMSALVGNGLGGGSLINAGVMERPDASVFDLKTPEKRRRWPAAITNEKLERYFNMAVHALQPATMPDAISSPARLTALMDLGRHSKRKDVIARKTNITVNFTEANAILKPCERCGDCFTGCNFGAKRSTDTNYLANAYRRGAQIYTGATVLHVQRHAENGRVVQPPMWRVYFTLTDSKISSSDPGPFYAIAKRVILAAGTFGSTEILMRSSASGNRKSRDEVTQLQAGDEVSAFDLALSPHLGKGFSGNGDMIAVAVNQPTEINAAAEEATLPKDRQSGPTITGMVDIRQDKDPLRRFVIEEMAIPGALRRVFEETITSFGALYAFSEQDKWPQSAFKNKDEVDPAAIDPEHVNRTAVYAMMGIDSADGQLEFPRRAVNARDDGWLVVRWPEVHRRQSSPGDSLYERQIHCLEKLQRGLPKTGAPEAPTPKVIPYPLWRPLPETMAEMVDLDSGPLLTVHPLGGCSMGEDVTSGVVDDIGQVFDYAPAKAHVKPKAANGTTIQPLIHEGLVVLDGSIVPTALGINPALTITALAERSCWTLKRRWGLKNKRRAAKKRKLDPRPKRAVSPAAPGGTAIQMAERMTGEVQLPNHEKRYLSLILEFEVIPDLMKFLRGGKKEIHAVCNKSYVQLYKSRDDLNKDPIALDDKEIGKSAARLCGTLEYLQREPSSKSQRVRTGLRALLRNRVRDLWAPKRRPVPRRYTFPYHLWKLPVRLLPAVRDLYRNPIPGPYTLSYFFYKLPARLFPAVGDLFRFMSHKRRWIANLLRFLTHVGEVRTLKYELFLQCEIKGSGLSEGGRLVGTKKIAYTPLGNPWRQLMEMSLDYYPPGSHSDAIPLATLHTPLRIDLGYFAQREQPLLKVVRQTDAPTTWADLTSLGLYLARIVGRIHFWSFRAPDERRVGWMQDYAARLPGFVGWVPDPQVIELRTGRASERNFIRLARYPASTVLGTPTKRSQKNPVVLLHGFGASGGTFAHRSIRRNMVNLLTRHGYEAWVVELRTSIGLLSSRQAYDFEQLAREDVVAAIDEVRYRTGVKEVDVVAHCVGAAMFCLAVLSGDLRDKIGAAVLSQVGPVTVFHRNNVFRGYMAAYLRRFFGTQIFEADVSPYRSTLQRGIDRLLATFPYPDAEARHEHPWVRWRCHAAIRHRADAIFGQLYASKNVPRKVRARLDELIGHVHVDSMAQLMFYARQRELTSADGLRSLLDRNAIRDNFAFPVLFLFGEDNQVFDVAGMHASIKLLEDQFEWGASGPKPFQLHPPWPGLGHQDGLIGPRLRKEVFPEIDRFLRLSRPDRPTARSKPKDEWAAPRFGPVIGWVRAMPDGGTRVCVALGSPISLPGAPWSSYTEVNGNRNELQFKARKVVVPYAAPRVASDRTHRALSCVAQLEVDLTRSSEESGADAAPHRPGVAGSRSVSDHAYIKRDDLEQSERLQFDDSVLEAADNPFGERKRLRFALGSCQYPAGLVDGDPADAAFTRLHELLDGANPPQLLLFAGDQIYVDETAGLFDVASPIERHVRPYERFYSRPAVKQVLKRLPVYCMLDDHEIVDNWEPPLVSDESAKAVQRDSFAAFEAYQWNMGPGSEFPHDLYIPNELKSPVPNGRRRYWYQFSPGGFGVFMMDTRTERDRRTLRKVPYDINEDSDHTGRISKAHIISKSQFAAVEAWLLRMNKRDEQAEPAPKFILSPSVVFPWYKDVEHDFLYAARCDGWDGFPASLRRLLRFIGENEIQNVVFLSGDYHLSCFAKATIRVSGRKSTVVRSIVSSGMYAPYPFANAKPDELALQSTGTWIGDRTLSCLVETLALARKGNEIDTRSDKRTVTDDGFATVEAALLNDAWTLKVEFHSRGGVFYRYEPLIPPTASARALRLPSQMRPRETFEIDHAVDIETELRR